MSKLSYWEKRQVDNMFRYMQKAEDTADQIADLYLKASRWLSLEADEIFERYLTKHNLSEAEARHFLNTLEDKTSIDEMLQKLKANDTDGNKRELIAKLESGAYRARIERLKQLQNQLDYVMETVYKQEKAISTSHYVDLADEAYYRTIFDIQQQAQAAFSFNHIDAKQIDKVVNSKWSGENYSSRIWKNTSALAQNLKEELLINLVTGRTEKEVADIIANKFAQSASNARRLVRTESAYLSAELNFKALEEAGVEEYQFLATLDLKTSETCRKMDMMIFKVKDRKVGQNAPPMHPWCRSTIVGIIDRKFLEGKKRVARDPKTGKIIYVPRTMTYDEWYSKYVKGDKTAELNEKKIKNRSADRKQHEEYRRILGDEIPEKLDDFQDMKYNNSEKWDEIKTQKQDALNKMDFSDMEGLKAKLGNKEVRLWYKAHDEKIPDLIDKSLPLREQAKQAFELRNQYRTQARELMSNQVVRKELDAKHRNLTFEEILEHKRKKYGLTENEAYEDIIRSSATTNKKYDKIAGIDEGN